MLPLLQKAAVPSYQKFNSQVERIYTKESAESWSRLTMVPRANSFPFCLFTCYIKRMCEENNFFHGCWNLELDWVYFSTLLTTFSSDSNYWSSWELLVSFDACKRERSSLKHLGSHEGWSTLLWYIRTSESKTGSGGSYRTFWSL